MKDSQFSDSEFGGALKEMVKGSKDFYREYVIEDHNFALVGKIPDKIALSWLRESRVFKSGLLTSYMIGYNASKDPSAPINWMNKGAIRVDDFESTNGQVWIYKHDFNYWIVRSLSE